MPTLLLLTTMRPDIQADFDARYTVHHHARLPDHWLETHGAEIDAVLTGGHNGISTAGLVNRAVLEALGRTARW